MCCSSFLIIPGTFHGWNIAFFIVKAHQLRDVPTIPFLLERRSFGPTSDSHIGASSPAPFIYGVA